ncbi:MAG: dihydroorotate dehydrogenase electron transfer subunit [Sedimentisphaerales bacterium]|nr:dihydroorotate dehydrogenase electron transfer subunit [Sedimentisphaerales bacterium]
MTDITESAPEISLPRAKGMFEAFVTDNKKIGHSFYKLKLTLSGEGAHAFANCIPGQFAELDVSEVPLPPEENIPEDLLDVSQREVLLRRPFSFTDVTVHGDKTVVDIMYCVLGPATLRLTTLKSGDSFSILGPLGNGFHVPEGKKYAILIAGGMGTPPLQHLGKLLVTNHLEIEVTAFAGAKSKNDLPIDGRLDEISIQLGFPIPEFARYGIESIIATDDGSLGYKGFVTDCFVEWLKEKELPAQETIIYSCGPEKMLSRVAQIAQERNIECQVSMERRMACGINLCQGCAVECKVPNSNETIYKMCCQDGPVFDGAEVIFVN